jgi:hypothetical protein
VNIRLIKWNVHRSGGVISTLPFQATNFAHNFQFTTHKIRTALHYTVFVKV